MRLRPAGVFLALCLPSPALAGVVINEFLPDPAGSDSTVELEWVELLNTGPAAIDVGGWTLEVGFNPAGYSVSHTFPAALLQPGDRLWIGEAMVPGIVNVTAQLDLPNAASGSGDAIRLVDAVGTPMDTVVYGPNNNDAFLDDNGVVAVSVAAMAGSDDSLARVPDGIDTDASGLDFDAFTVPTPNASNDAAIPPDTGDTGLTPVGCGVTGVVLNELEADPSGADGVLEWVELYNPGAVDVDVSGWTIEAGPSSFSTSGMIPSGTVVPAGGFLVVGQSAIPEADIVATGFVMSNASASADAVRLVACDGSTVDTVVYGTPNTDSWTDDTGVVAVSLAPTADEPSTLGRIADGVDTDLCGVDFAELTPSPGATNASGGGGPVGSCDDAVAGGALVINELLPDPDGTDDGLEWVEVYNAGSTAVDVSGWAIVAGTSSFSGSGTLPEGTILAAGAYLVVGQAAIPEADVVAAGWSLGNASSSSDGVRLEDCGGAVVDTVIYGTPNTDGWIDDTGAEASSLGPKPGGGETLARAADGVDTDASAVDFAVDAFPSPGASNDAPAVDCGAVGSGVKINEFLYDPDSSDTGLEWVELFHAGSASVDLSGWAIEKATSSYAPAFVFPGGTSIAPGQILLVGEASVPGSDFVAELGMGNASSSADGVRLVDCAGFPADTVVYGDANTDGLVDDSLAAATSLAPGVGGGSSLQRVEDGYDTDQSAVDFAEQEIPTPGISNPIVAPVICAPSDGTVVLNEFVPNPASTDTSAEWVELFNNGASPADVSGWGIDTATSTWGDPDAVFPGGSIIEPGGFLVIGGALSPATVIAEISLGNATSSADGIRLLDCTGVQVDTVVYGEANPDGLLDDAGSVVPSLVPGEAGSLARDPDGFDTDSATDWVLRGAPSPGETNFFDAGSFSEEEPRGCGCGGGAPDDGAPEPGGCATDPVRAHGLWVAAGLLIAARRRRNA